ncbi:MAG TPA: outer membrane beta-barrel protein [Candidatus Cybelea sp.]|nr:outer membrane beta-barrel protein [Candidatus Cybelea sp.]
MQTRSRVRDLMIKGFAVIGVFACGAPVDAQSAASPPAAVADHSDAMQERINKLETRVVELEAIVKQLQAALSLSSGGASSALLANTPLVPPSSSPASAGSTRRPSSAPNALPNPNAGASASSAPAPDPAPAKQNTLPPEDRQALDFLRDTTIGLGIDTYYEYNFNNPVGRVNLLRAYDVLSNEFSLNQASLIFDHPPDVDQDRRWGGRLDLQFGQATETLQGNPMNEPRPDIYRNVFQVYGTYVVPLGKGITVDFGKFASSLGFEGNYTKDQMNYSRSYWFDFLPFYHMGLRAAIPVNNRFTINYWVVNGTDQVEATNGYKDELWGFTAEPVKTVTWTMNYYRGQEHPDRVVAPPSTCPIPLQPDLCFQAISPAPNGLTNILDSYATWHARAKLTLAVEADYYNQRLWEHAAPGEPTNPTHVDGGAAYIQYQFSPKFALAGRAEYLSDRGGDFSGLTQALKEDTVTFDYNVAHGFLMRYEWRRDYSNQPTFYTDVQGVFAKQQDTATIGVIWWWGTKEGAW